MREPIAARGVTKTFGSKTALDGVSAGVFPGDIVGVLGKNGAGKTTLLETLLGFSPPTRGSTTVFGEDSRRLSAAVKDRIGFVPQQDELLGIFTGKQQLAISPRFARTGVGRSSTAWPPSGTCRSSRSTENLLEAERLDLDGGLRARLAADAYHQRPRFGLKSIASAAS